MDQRTQTVVGVQGQEEGTEVEVEAVVGIWTRAEQVEREEVAVAPGRAVEAVVEGAEAWDVRQELEGMLTVPEAVRVGAVATMGSADKSVLVPPALAVEEEGAILAVLEEGAAEAVPSERQP